MNNVPENIKSKIGKNLHRRPGHPLSTIRELIYKALPDFKKFDDFLPTVSTEKNFDLLRIPKDHPSRRATDTYYVDDTHVLRTHTSAHQVDLLWAGERQFLVTGDVYRKDDIDQTHYPVFHQMEGVRITPKGVNPLDDLRDTVDRILETLFPKSKKYWSVDYFPFTDPSFEVEVEIRVEKTELLGGGKMKFEVAVPGEFETKHMEVLGCGVIHPEVLKNGGRAGETGWAFGLGLERLAMKLFGIPDIRLFWSEDPRFLGQFKPGEITTFQPFSKHPACYKDIAFWAKPEYEAKELMELIRRVAGDLVENVTQIDKFEKAGRTSYCYRILYRLMERTLTNEEVDRLQEEIRKEVAKLPVELR